MKAMRYHAYGEPLRLEDVPRPEPAADEVLIKVAATAVNPFDSKVRSGAFKDMFPVNFPATPGLEASGVVALARHDVSDLAAGDEVYARVREGYAEYAVAKATDAVRKPPQLGFFEAAAIPVALDTAWSVLFDLANLQAGQRVLILGAAGSVGSVAVQLAKWKGAFVIGTASAANLDFLRALGVDVAIDYAATPVEAAAKGMDVVFDTVGGDGQSRLFATLRAGGVLVSIIGPPSQELAAEHGVRALARFSSTDPLTLRKTQHLVQDGVVRPTVRRIFPLEEANEAEAFGRSGHGRGKIVLQVAEP
jgi:NADPH:quinone reductase-like Zn-dependent oxidoreductase